MGRITERSCTHLTDWQIADAFPEECNKYYKLRFKASEIMINDFLLNAERICEEYPDDFEREFFIKINFILMTDVQKEYKKKYDRSKKILDFVKVNKRISNNTNDKLNIDAAKSKPIEDLYCFEIMRENRKQIFALCPFHKEKTPSFCIYTSNNRFHCFGCKSSGDSIDFIMKLTGLNFIDAVKYLIGGQYAR